MVAVVVAVLHPIELISFNFDFDELFHPSPVGHWFARFRFCHSYWWFWLWFWFCFYFHFRQFIFVECSSLFYFGLFCFVLSTNSVLLPLSIALSVRSSVRLFDCHCHRCFLFTPIVCVRWFIVVSEPQQKHFLSNFGVWQFSRLSFNKYSMNAYCIAKYHAVSEKERKKKINEGQREREREENAD